MHIFRKLMLVSYIIKNQINGHSVQIFYNENLVFPHIYYFLVFVFFIYRYNFLALEHFKSANKSTILVAFMSKYSRCN